jgi:hypothetical protein
MDRLKCEFKMKTTEESRGGGVFPGLQHTLGGVEGRVGALDGTRKNDKHLFTHTNLHKIKQQIG